jgi:putative membrane protein
MWPGYGGNGGWGGWIVGAQVMVAFFALLVTAIVLVVRYFTGGGRGAGSSPQTRGAEDVLAERLARGEINDDEYRRPMTLLREHR